MIQGKAPVNRRNRVSNTYVAASYQTIGSVRMTWGRVNRVVIYNARGGGRSYCPTS